MSLSNEQSETLRRLARNSLSEANLREVDLARPVSPWIPPSTLNKLLTTDQEISEDQADILLHFVPQIAGLDEARARSAVENVAANVLLPEAELALADCASAGTEEIDSLVARTRGAAMRSTRLITHRELLPPFLLEPDVTQKALAYMVERTARDPQLALTLLREHCIQQHETFMNTRSIGRAREITVSIFLSNLIRMVRRKAPFAGCSRDEINVAVESLIHDAVLERGVLLAVINDIAPGPGRLWAWAHDQFATITLFGSGLLVKRRYGTLSCRIFDAASDPRSQTIVEHNAQLLAEGVRHRCHGLDKDEIVAFLRKFLVASGSRPKVPFWLN
jgi:hypothetical protein